jgi:3-methyladenine DNA glycosylase AlkD
MRTITPKQLSAEAIKLLKSHGEQRVAHRSRSYFKPHEKVCFYGVKVPVVRRIERELFATVRAQWEFEQALEFCDLVTRERQIESRTVGILLLSRFKRQFGRDLIRVIERWLRDDRFDNWALTDTAAPYLIAPLLGSFPDLTTTIERWTRSRNLWVRRSALVSLIYLVRKGRELDLAYRLAESLFGDCEDLIHKATGWLLRESGKTDQTRLQTFLLERGSMMHRTALRYAIERFPEETRKMILVSTASSR